MPAALVVPSNVVPRVRSGRPCLDLTHTRTDPYMDELIHDDADLALMLRIILSMPAVDVSSGDMQRTMSLRTAITACAEATIAGRPLPQAHVTTINAAATEPAAVPVLTRTGTMRLAPGTARQALSTLARDAIDLFSNDLGERLRTCSGNHCGLFFLDTSRPNQRRWCSMDLCGNRNKTRAYRARATD